MREIPSARAARTHVTVYSLERATNHDSLKVSDRISETLVGSNRYRLSVVDPGRLNGLPNCSPGLNHVG